MATTRGRKGKDALNNDNDGEDGEDGDGGDDGDVATGRNCDGSNDDHDQSDYDWCSDRGGDGGGINALTYRPAMRTDYLYKCARKETGCYFTPSVLAICGAKLPANPGHGHYMHGTVNR